MKDPSQILAEVVETQREKNDDYGDSWRLVGQTLDLWADGDLSIDTNPDTLTSLGLFTRRLDKLIRAFNGEFVADDLNHESIQDSHRDEAGYAGMHAALLAEQEPVTYERIDMMGSASDGLEILDSVEATIMAGGVNSNETYTGSFTFDNTDDEEDDLATEDDYDEALPIHPPYQEKYEELVAD